MKRIFLWPVFILAVIFLCWLFPLFHIVPLKTATAEKITEKFDATKFAENFWTNKLLLSLDQAVSVKTLLPAIQADATAAKKKFSRSVGLSESYYYFVRGEGKIISISDDEIFLAVTENSTNSEIILETGLIFGDAIRDGTGLLDVND